MRYLLLIVLFLGACQVTGGPSRLVEQTTGVLHVYANGTSGNDTWDGSAATNTVGTLVGPKKTLQAVFNLVPYLVRHNTAVHLAGTFTDPGNTWLTKEVDTNITLLVDGGPDTTTVADNGGSPWNADINSTTSIGLTTAGWVVDAYRGYWVVILSGAAAGQTRLIARNTATTITPVKNFANDPGAGAQFRIVRPSTTIATSTTSYIYFVNRSSTGAFQIQRLYTSGTKTSFASVYASTPPVGGAAYVANVLDSSSAQPLWMNGSAYLTATVLDPTTFTAVPLVSIGTSQRSASGAVKSTGQINGHSGFVAYKFIANSGGPSLFTGFDAYTIELHGCATDANYGYGNIIATAGYRTGLGSASVTSGLIVTDSQVTLGSGIDVSNCTSHGITLNRSHLTTLGALTGTGNTGAGVYAFNNSVVNTKAGTTPTLTGTIGDISTDGTTLAGTWAGVEAGTPIVDLTELTLIKTLP